MTEPLPFLLIELLGDDEIHTESDDKITTYQIDWGDLATRDSDGLRDAIIETRAAIPDGASFKQRVISEIRNLLKSAEENEEMDRAINDRMAADRLSAARNLLREAGELPMDP